MPKDSLDLALSFALVVAAFALFYLILQLDVSGLLKFILVVAEMLAVGQYFIKRYKFSTELGMILLKSDHGIALIDRIARIEGVFTYMADVGTTISYGLLSFFLMRKNFSLKSAIPGFVCLAILSMFVAPTALVFLFQVVKIGSIDKPVSSMASQDSGLGTVLLGMLVIGGLFLFILSGIVLYGVIVLSALGKTLFFGTNAIANTTAGGTFLLPGINLPLFEGILALAIVMIVHEGAHAILTRIANVRLLSSGLVLFGVIPVGAFVEPDEKKLARTEQGKQTRVLVAGPTANLLASIAFLVLFFGFFYTTQGMRDTGYLIYSGMIPGTIVHAIDGVPVDLVNYTNLSLPKNATLHIDTNLGPVVKSTDENGKLGITYVPITKSTLITKFNVPGFDFIYMLLGLTLSLNFVVGAVNILPVPLFDGGRLIEINVKNKMIVNAISYVTLFFLLLNFLPLLFH
jgi:membrane-associated protease RseP (regulator of RpoE activity)